MLNGSIGLTDILVILLYLFATLYLGWLGYTRTKTAADYLIAGRKAHPFVMALSYGATFISTSAIVGFGGVAGLFGMSLLWLVFLNIFVGIFIAFVFLGPATRRMGQLLNAHTFPELLGRRYESKFIQVFLGLVIFLFMPLYAAAVLIGGAEFISTQFGISYNTALFAFTLVIAVYVVIGGLKGVMYADALQGCIMLVGMVTLLVFVYAKMGGITSSHQALTDIEPLVPDNLRAMGHRGWTATPAFGFGDKQYDLWWIVFSTITFGVGFGVLAQPQLAVRFMTVRSNRELNRAVPLAGVFIFFMVFVPYIVGSLSNLYFTRYGEALTGRVVKTIDAQKQYAMLQPMAEQGGVWADANGAKPVPAVLTGKHLGVITKDGNDLPVVQGRSISIVYAKGNSDQIMPIFITSAMPRWFGLLFLLTLLSAAMSTISSQFHAVGTSFGRDFYEQVTNRAQGSVVATGTGMVIGIIIAVFWSYCARGEYIIARATAIFFGLCLSSFLPMFVGALFFRRMTRAAAIASMVSGFAVSSFWLLFVKAAEAGAIGLVQKLTDGKTSILADRPNWPVVDSLVIALPVSALVAVIVSLVTKPPSSEHLSRCFAGSKEMLVVNRFTVGE